MSSTPGALGLWKPLRVPIFRELLVADVVSDVGTFMQSVGAAWLMVSMHASPFYIALTQTASAAPFFLLALPAGSLGDIVDRRKLILYTEAWMLAVALILAVTTLAGVITPWLLLALTFALSAGDAVESPTWRAVLPELVAKDDLPAASALNGIEFNIARAVGPALAGLLIAAAGVGAAFLVNVLSFFGVILVIARWKRPVRKRTAPPEELTGATIAALRYVRHVPAMQAIMFRSSAAMFCASASFALLPVIASRASSSSIAYGLLLGAFGVGAVVGAFAMQAARTRWSTEAIVAAAIAVQGLMTVALGRLHGVPGLMLAMFVSGGAWITFISLANALVQSLAPDWVRARVLAIFMLVTQGGLALGSVVWGAIGSRAGVESALLWAGLTTISTIGLVAVASWPDGTVDVSPWVHWRLPVMIAGRELTPDQGPVLVAIEYRVEPARVDAFLEAMDTYQHIRRRDGASRWGIFRDVEDPNLYLEIFIVASWAEHLRQHERFTVADRAIEQRIAALTQGEPRVRHLIQPTAP